MVPVQASMLACLEYLPPVRGKYQRARHISASLAESPLCEWTHGLRSHEANVRLYIEPTTNCQSSGSGTRRCLKQLQRLKGLIFVVPGSFRPAIRFPDVFGISLVQNVNRRLTWLAPLVQTAL